MLKIIFGFNTNVLPAGEQVRTRTSVIFSLCPEALHLQVCVRKFCTAVGYCFNFGQHCLILYISLPLHFGDLFHPCLSAWIGSTAIIADIVLYVAAQVEH